MRKFKNKREYLDWWADYRKAHRKKLREYQRNYYHKKRKRKNKGRE